MSDFDALIQALQRAHNEAAVAWEAQQAARAALDQALERSDAAIEEERAAQRALIEAVTGVNLFTGQPIAGAR